MRLTPAPPVWRPSAPGIPDRIGRGSPLPGDGSQTLHGTGVERRRNVVVTMAPIIGVARIGGKVVGPQDRQGSPALGGETLRSAPVEEGVVPVVSLLGVAGEQDVHVAVQVEVVGEDPRSGVAGNLHFARRVEPGGTVPVDPGGVAARIASVVAAQDQVQEPVPVQVGHRGGRVSHRRQDGPVRFRVAFRTAPVDEGVPLCGAAEGPGFARRRYPGRRGWRQSRPESRFHPDRRPPRQPKPEKAIRTCSSLSNPSGLFQ